MSIAVSAVIQPSKLLLSLVGGMSVISLGIAVLVATGFIGSLSPLARVFLAVMCASVAIAVFLREKRKTQYVIHISGVGQIRLRTGSNIEHAIVDGAEDEIVHLLPASTIWSGLLLLHLQNDLQQRTVVTVLRDTVSAESFRALLVACRWIVLRHADASESNIRH